MNRYELTDEVREKFTPTVKEFIEKAQEKEFAGDLLELTGTELNPYTIWKLLEELGYEKNDFDTNGWELDFWITMVKSDFKDISIRGTGITFELNLYIGE